MRIAPGSLLPSILGATLALSALAATRDAHADVSSWLFVGNGPSWISQRKLEYELKPSMQIDFGVGSPVSKPVVIGGLVRATPYFGKGTDLALAARIATQGFAVGDWGVAIDGGAFKRWWRTESSGWLTSLQLGAPYGITLSVNASFGSEDNRTYGAILGVDLLRLTVYRLGGEKWWANPRPAWRPGEEPTQR
ncbi:MAG: hypothetical protein HY898_23695 [Deltaproteobacteria bacterium]|nr:hypothetical protein [Deltaproteobacteria bacterium]